MKTMKSLIGLKGITYFAAVCFLFLFSCNENQLEYGSSDNANVQSEANSDAQLEDVSDMAAVAVSADNGTLTGGRSDEMNVGARSIKGLIHDLRLACAEVTLEFANDNQPGTETTAIPHGTITIDFGAGCTGPHGKVRKGKIVIEFYGRRFMPGSFLSITFVDFYVNGIKLEGNRTETNVSESNTSPVRFNIVETDMRVTWPDGTFATRSVNKLRQWDRAANPFGDIWTVSNGSNSLPAASGVNRRGKAYTMNITKTLVFKRECAITNNVVIPVEGIKELVTDTKKVVMDFGTGACDNLVTITINGKSKDVEVSTDGN